MAKCDEARLLKTYSCQKTDQKWPKILLVVKVITHTESQKQTQKHSQTHTHTHTHTHSPTRTHTLTHTHTAAPTHGDTDEYFRDVIVAIKELPAPIFPGF